MLIDLEHFEQLLQKYFFRIFKRKLMNSARKKPLTIENVRKSQRVGTEFTKCHVVFKNLMYMDDDPMTFSNVIVMTLVMGGTVG